MSKRSIQLGPTGRAVAANLKRLRQSRGMTLRQLSAELASRGRALSIDALNQIENGADEDQRRFRRVDVDDLTALAAAFAVPAATLLEVPDCAVCFAAPPPGFTCRTCGTEA